MGDAGKAPHPGSCTWRSAGLFSTPTLVCSTRLHQGVNLFIGPMRGKAQRGQGQSPPKATQLRGGRFSPGPLTGPPGGAHTLTPTPAHHRRSWARPGYDNDQQHVRRAGCAAPDGSLERTQGGDASAMCLHVEPQGREEQRALRLGAQVVGRCWEQRPGRRQGPICCAL